MKYDLDILVPVFREEGNISKTLEEIFKVLKLNYRILIIYDYDEDPTLEVITKKFKNDSYKPQQKFGGHTECFKISSLILSHFPKNNS